MIIQRDIPDFLNLAIAKYASENFKTVIFQMGGNKDPINPELLKHISILILFKNELDLVIASTGLNKNPESQSDETHIIELMVKFRNLNILYKGPKGLRFFEWDKPKDYD